MENKPMGIQLEAPGAGLPRNERRFLQIGLKAYSRFASNRMLTTRFSRSAELLVVDASRLSGDQGTQKVLIDRIPGIEDSSRFWSVFMVLEHLVIVNQSVAGIIRSLYRGRPISQEVRIADVKPHDSAGVEHIERFRRSTEVYIGVVERLGDLHSPSRHPHPWFGPLDAHQWHCLAAVHNTLHRQQVRKISAKL